jgi:hypothetical protein
MREEKGETGGSAKVEEITCGERKYGRKLYRAELKVLHLASTSALYHWEVIVAGLVEGVEGMV